MALSRGAANFVHALIAVIAGNLVYFLLMPYLPVRLQHVAPQVDVGLLVDFAFCGIALWIVKTVAGRRRTL